MSSFISAGYNISRSKQWLGLNHNLDSANQFRTVHYFFSRQGLTIHGVVLFKRHKFLWNAGLLGTDGFDIKGGWLFAKEVAFEK